MANYRYHVITRLGKEKRGGITAADRDQALAALKNNGCTVISLEEPSIWDKEIELPFLRPRVKPRDLSIFCRQFVTLMQAGVSIVRALEMLEEQTINKVLREAVRETRFYVEKGETLAGGMKRYDKVFSPMFINLIKAGEEAGKLELAFERMALHFEKATKLQSVVRKAMIYPIILAAVSVVVVIVMLAYIVPMYANLFDKMGAALPVMTRRVIGFSSFVANFWYLILLGIFLLLMGFKAYSSTENGDCILSSLALKLPVIGKLKQKNACASFSRNLSTLLSAGVSIIDALQITADTMDNTVYKIALRDAGEQVSRGIQLSDSLRESGIFPPMVYHMVGIGEETGGLDAMLNKAAEYYEEEVTAAAEQAAAALEPMIILIMAFVVIVIIFSVFTPMMTMYGNMDNL